MKKSENARWNMRILTHEDVLSMIPDRMPESHKGHYGKLLLLCGSVGYSGAAALAAMAALRTGAGLVYLGVPETIYKIEAGRLLEPIVFPLDDENGAYAATAAKKIVGMLQRMDAVLIGPGVGRSEGVYRVLQAVLEEFSGPVVVDADGITLLSEHKDLVRGRNGRTILTPHTGEFQRLYGNIGDDRRAAAVELARDLNSVVLLKGHRTIITDGQNCYENHTGNPGMAVGGCGDVLAGIITALLGFRLPLLEAAACGAWIHGAAGDLCAKQIGQYGMLPSDMIQAIPRLLK